MHSTTPTNRLKINLSELLFVGNLHPSTPTVEIGVAIEEISFSVRQVTNVIQKTTRNNLPIFFVDLEPAAINPDIFSVTSLPYTKIKIEEPHNRRDILQCDNCQDYSHSKKYCSYSPRCVRCEEEHPSPIAPKPWICQPSVPSARETIPPITKIAKHTKVSNSFVNPP